MELLARAALDDLVTTVFPGDCRVCGGVLLQAKPTPVCDVCFKKIKRQALTLCRCCGEVLDMDLESDRFIGEEWSGEGPAEGVLCAPCRLAPPPFERAVAFGTHEAEIRELVHLLKYEGVRSLAKPLGAKLAETIEGLNLEGAISVVAVPLFPAKERERGFNQAVLLADAAVRALEYQAPKLRLRSDHSLLRRIRETESQYSLTARQRLINVRSAFAVDKKRSPLGLTVLLVDDVYTTGATVRECARVLRRAGAAKVYVATLARAQAEQAARWSWHGEGKEHKGANDAGSE